MKKIMPVYYDAHLDYETELDLALLNMKILIYGEEKGAGEPYFVGTVGKFVRERVPSDEVVTLLPKLKTEEKVLYRLKTETIVIQRRV